MREDYMIIRMMIITVKKKCFLFRYFSVPFLFALLKPVWRDQGWTIGFYQN